MFLKLAYVFVFTAKCFALKVMCILLEMILNDINKLAHGFLEFLYVLELLQECVKIISQKMIRTSNVKTYG